jgi:hypothetical protein
MNLAEALAAVEAGKRVRSSAISKGWVVKAEGEGWGRRVRVVNEATGSSFDFTARPEHDTADWQIVEGWSIYA